jgi:hypothetical protein
MKYVGFTLEDVCALYSILPHELDEASLVLLKEDLDSTCMAMFGKHAFIYGELEVLK